MSPATFTGADLHTPRGVNQASRCFSRDGVLSLAQVFDSDLIDRVLGGFVDRYGGLSEDELKTVGSRVGHERYMISVHWAAPFDAPDLWAHPVIERLLVRILGPAFVLNSFAMVVAFPGAADQHVHMDHHLLFEGAVLSRALPPYAATLAIPLIDLSPPTGGTRVWIGSHRKLPGFIGRRAGGVVLRPQRTDAYLMDYRLLHGGTANTSALARPVMYMAYSRPWFRDAANFVRHPPIRIDRTTWSALPDGLRKRIPPPTSH